MHGLLVGERAIYINLPRERLQVLDRILSTVLELVRDIVATCFGARRVDDGTEMRCAMILVQDELLLDGGNFVRLVLVPDIDNNGAEHLVEVDVADSDIDREAAR